jgi:Mrp family chromosome partitioning ATPase
VPAHSPGFVEAARGRASVEDCLQRGAHERLAVVSCGDVAADQDGVLLLGQPEASQLLGLLVARGRRAVVDLPPVGEDEGAFELACAARHVIIVARHGVTERAQLAALVRRLESRGCRVAGAVLLDVPPERQHPYAGPSAAALVRSELQRLTPLLRRRKAHA